MTSTLIILGAWFAVSVALCLLLGAVVRRGEEGLDTSPAAPARPAGGRARAAVAPAPAPVVAPSTTRPLRAVTGGRPR